MGVSAITGINLGVPAFQQNFADGDLSSGVLTVTHNLNSQYVAVTVYNNNDLIIIPDDVTATSGTVTTIDINSFGTIAGTWRAVIIDKGATVSIQPSPNPPAVTTAFQVSGNSLQTNLPTGSTLVQFSSVSFDIGGNFDDVTNYNFTAPVTGIYHFTARLQLLNIDTASTNISMQMIGGTGSSSSFLDPRQFAGDILGKYTIWLQQTIRCTTGQTVHINYQQLGGSAQTDIDFATFTGFIVGTN